MTEEQRKDDPAAIAGVPRDDFKALHEFTALQWEKLKRNAHKGGWVQTRLGVLRKRLDEELREMDAAAVYFIAVLNDGSDEERDRALSDFRFECADVANFCMMLADRARAMVPSLDDNVRQYVDVTKYLTALRDTIDGFNAFRALASKGTVSASYRSVETHPAAFTYGWSLSIVYRGREYGVMRPSFDNAVRELLAAVEPAG